MNAADPVDILAELAAMPAAPYHEERVAVVVARQLRRIGLIPTVDEFGNLIVDLKRGQPHQSVALVAHLDHPGIEIVEVLDQSTARAVLRGGVRPTYFNRPVRVQVAGKSSTFGGEITGYDVDPRTGRVSELRLSYAGEAAVGDYGVFDVTAFAAAGDELVLRAADDLVGVAAILATLERVGSSGQDASVYGAFTRAEEVGLVGAEALAEARPFPSDTIVISLECSAKRPGAEPGLGPVIRVGDRAQSFDPRAEALLLAARDRLAGVAIQRQLMDGGRCEAGAFLRAGYQTTGIAIPLTNYHNMGPEDTVVPERIHRSDLLGEVALLVEACQVAGRGPSEPPVRISSGDDLRGRLRLSAPNFQKLAQPLA